MMGFENQDAIIVTMNYRLGALGWLASSDHNISGNFGLLDQRFAMQWVKDNIANFGGDPNRVTIFGESAGSGSTSAHLLMQNSWPLFDQAILESGPIAYWTARPLSSYSAVTDYYMNKTGCSTLDCLRKVDPVTLMDDKGVAQVKEMILQMTFCNCQLTHLLLLFIIRF